MLAAPEQQLQCIMADDKNFIVREHTTSCQHLRGYYRSTATSQEEELQLAVKQYIPKSSPSPQQGDVTIIAAHCAGMFKELYEPVFSQLITLSERAESKFRIRAIWIADLATHGASARLNEGKLGIDLSWDDHARDLLHLTNVFRHEMVRPLVGFGHSAGGAMITRLAAMHPRLFASLLLIEPAINKEYSPKINLTPTYFMSYQRDIWPTREQAFEETTKKGTQRYWDKRVLARWYEYGFREGPTLEYPETNATTFATTKHHATRAYARAVHPPPGKDLLDVEIQQRTHPDIKKHEFQRAKQPAYAPTTVAAYRDVPHLLPSVLFVYGEKSTIAASSLENRAGMIPLVGTGFGGSGGQAEDMVKEVIIEKSAHFVPFERPDAVAEKCDAWLQEHIPSWFAREKKNHEEWQNRGDARDKAMLDSDWMWWAKEAYAKKSKI